MSLQQFVRSASRTGDYVRGAEHDKAKLTDDQVLSIRLRAHAGETLTALASEHDVAISVICRIVTGRGWTHIGGPTREPRSYNRKKINNDSAD